MTFSFHIWLSTFTDNSGNVVKEIGMKYLYKFFTKPVLNAIFLKADQGKMVQSLK